VSRKDYELIATTLNTRKPDEEYLLTLHPQNVVAALIVEWENLVHHFANVLADKEELFNKTKFIDWCNE